MYAGLLDLSRSFHLSRHRRTGVAPAWRLIILLTVFASLSLATSHDSLAWIPSWEQGEPGDVLGIADLRITEIMYNPVGGNDYEFVEVKNTGATAVNMAGVAFSLGVEFTFPAGFSLPAHQFAVVVGNPTAFAERYPGVSIAGQYAGQLNNDGEEILLSASGGAPLLNFAYDNEAPWPVAPDGDGYSLVVINPNINPGNPANWRASTFPNGSPGQDDPPRLERTVVINEILANSTLPFEDAIELHNLSSQPVSIGGWYLSDSPTTLTKYRIPDGTVLSGSGYLVFYEYQFNSNPGVPPSFALGAQGDQVYLASADTGGALTGYTTGVSFGASESNVSIGRHVTSVGVHFLPMASPTFGVNAPATVQEFRTGHGAANSGPRIGPVVINELMYNPSTGGDEFVELLNTSGGPVQLFDPSDPANSWQFTSGISYTFPANTSLAADTFGLVVAIDPAVFRATHQIPPAVPIFGPYVGALSNGGERVELSRPVVPPGAVSHVAVDRITYSDETPWPVTPDGTGPSLERIRTWEYGNDPVNWAASSAVGGSPGRRNSVSPNVTPTWTATVTRTPTPTATSTPSPTVTATHTSSATPSPTSSTISTVTPTVTSTSAPSSPGVFLPIILHR